MNCCYKIDIKEFKDIFLPNSLVNQIGKFIKNPLPNSLTKNIKDRNYIYFDNKLNIISSNTESCNYIKPKKINEMINSEIKEKCIVENDKCEVDSLLINLLDLSYGDLQLRYIFYLVANIQLIEQLERGQPLGLVSFQKLPSDYDRKETIIEILKYRNALLELMIYFTNIASHNLNFERSNILECLQFGLRIFIKKTNKKLRNDKCVNSPSFANIGFDNKFCDKISNLVDGCCLPIEENIKKKLENFIGKDNGSKKDKIMQIVENTGCSRTKIKGYLRNELKPSEVKKIEKELSSFLYDKNISKKWKKAYHVVTATIKFKNYATSCEKAGINLSKILKTDKTSNYLGIMQDYDKCMITYKKTLEKLSQLASGDKYMIQTIYKEFLNYCFKNIKNYLNISENELNPPTQQGGVYHNQSLQSYDWTENIGNLFLRKVIEGSHWLLGHPKTCLVITTSLINVKNKICSDIKIKDTINKFLKKSGKKVVDSLEYLSKIYNKIVDFFMNIDKYIKPYLDMLVNFFSTLPIPYIGNIIKFFGNIINMSLAEAVRNTTIETIEKSGINDFIDKFNFNKCMENHFDAFDASGKKNKIACDVKFNCSEIYLNQIHYLTGISTINYYGFKINGLKYDILLLGENHGNKFSCPHYINKKLHVDIINYLIQLSKVDPNRCVDFFVEKKFSRKYSGLTEKRGGSKESTLIKKKCIDRDTSLKYNLLDYVRYMKSDIEDKTNNIRYHEWDTRINHLSSNEYREIRNLFTGDRENEFTKSFSDTFVKTFKKIFGNNISKKIKKGNILNINLKLPRELENEKLGYRINRPYEILNLAESVSLLFKDVIKKRELSKIIEKIEASTSPSFFSSMRIKNSEKTSDRGGFWDDTNTILFTIYCASNFSTIKDKEKYGEYQELENVFKENYYDLFKSISIKLGNFPALSPDAESKSTLLTKIMNYRRLTHDILTDESKSKFLKERIEKIIMNKKKNKFIKSVNILTGDWDLNYRNYIKYLAGQNVDIQSFNDSFYNIYEILSKTLNIPYIDKKNHVRNENELIGLIKKQKEKSVFKENETFVNCIVNSLINTKIPPVREHLSYISNIWKTSALNAESLNLIIDFIYVLMAILYPAYTDLYLYMRLFKRYDESRPFHSCPSYHKLSIIYGGASHLVTFTEPATSTSGPGLYDLLKSNSLIKEENYPKVDKCKEDDKLVQSESQPDTPIGSSTDICEKISTKNFKNTIFFSNKKSKY